MGIARFLSALLPHLNGLRIETCSLSEQGVTVAVASGRCSAQCPICHRRSRRIHARFTRTLADLPWGGQVVHIHLEGRRFRCTNRRCPRQTFRERLPQLALPYRRRTRALSGALEAIGFALGGQPGARLARLCQMPVSRMTLLRLVRLAAAPPATTPRVLGVDDWAFRRGRLYGTILVDLERHCPVDLLPDRTAATLADWLRAHPGVEIASRDRGGAYADGIRQGAPNAVQVADRFHLVKNLGDAFELVLVRQAALLRHLAAEVDAEAQAPPATPDGPETAPAGCSRGTAGASGASLGGDLPLAAPSTATASPASSASGDEPAESAPATPLTTRSERERLARRERRLARYHAVHAAAQSGMTQRQIARTLGLGRETVGRFLRADVFPEQGRRRRHSRLEPYQTYLREQWDAGVQDAAGLWRALRARGYSGAASTVRQFLARWRHHPGGQARCGRRPRSAVSTAAPAPACTNSPHRTRWLLLRPDLARDATEQHYVERLVERCPPIAQARDLVLQFISLVRNRAAPDLGAWLVAAQRSGIVELRGFARGIRRDEAAVRAALSLDWSQGQTEGHVNRLKTLKRQMYGRAAFPLLRQRLLHPA